MTKDEIQFWMLIAFAIAFVFSSFKIYIIFNTPVEGMDTKTQHKELETIIVDFLKQLDCSDLSSTQIFYLIIRLDVLQDSAYRSFNENRFNQLLQQLFYTYEVTSLEQLILSIKNEQRYLNAQFHGYFILVPRSSFFKKAEEPMLFASLKNNNYYWRLKWPWS